MIKKLHLFCFLLFSLIGFAQDSASLDPSFYSTIPSSALIGFTNNHVYSIFIQSDGKILAGGQFSKYNNLTARGLIRLNMDGSKDDSFLLNELTNVYAITQQSDGKILAAGDFDYTAKGIVRLNNNGTVDPSFIVGTGFKDTAGVIIIKAVVALVVQPDGKILVGGDFTYYKGVSSKRIIRLNSDGSIDTSFNIGTGFNKTVQTIVLQPDGKILVGGDFTTYQGTTSNRIIRLNSDGTKDLSFNTGTGSNTFVKTLALQPDSKILVGGEFTTYNGTTANRIIRLNNDGTIDPTFITTGFNGFNDILEKIVIQADGKILAGGQFDSYNGNSFKNIIRFNNDGSIDTSFNIGKGFNGTVDTLTVQPDGSIISGGGMGEYDGYDNLCIIKLHNDGSKDPNFNTGKGFNSIVKTSAQQQDGKILMGGRFDSYNSTIAGKLIRLNSNGSIDPSFNTGPGFNYEITAIAIQPDGKIIACGEFTNYNGSPSKGIIRLNNDGSIDTTFNSGTGFAGPYLITKVRTIALQSDGKIVIGGNFTAYNGITANKIIRLNSNGSIDPTFVVGTGFNYEILSIVVQPDGKILIGGNFTIYNSTTANKIIRLNNDGSIDTSFVVGTGFNYGILSIVVQPDGKILAGGGFTTYKGISAGRIIRLNNDGSIDPSFIIGATAFDSSVITMTLQPDGKIFVGGDFYTYNNLVSQKIIRLNSNGSHDMSFNSTISGFDGGYMADTVVNTLNLQSDGGIVVGGSFLRYNNGTPNNRIIKLDSNGNPDTFFNSSTGFNNSVNAIALQPDGKILASGDYTAYNGATTNRLIRLNNNANIDTSFNTESGFNYSLKTIVLQPDGKILAGGDFTNFNGIITNRIIRLNGNGIVDPAFNVGTGFNNSVSAISLQNDGKILVGGYFTSYNGTAVNRIIRLNSNGSIDTTFNTGAGFNNLLNTITLQTDGKILVGGDFTTYNGVTKNRLIRLNNDGGIDTSFDTGTGLNGLVNTIISQSNGKILMGGIFSTYNGVPANKLIRLNNDGSIDSLFNIGTGFDNIIKSIAIQSDGKILVGGFFTTYNGIASKSLIRLNNDGTKDATFNTATGFDNVVNAIVLQTDGKILVGGDFTLYKTQISNRLVRLMGNITTLSTSINTYEKKLLVLYPNPVKDLLHFTSTETNIHKYEIYDLIGKKVVENIVSGNTINVSNLTNGFYIIILHNNEAVLSRKFIKE
ncbi:T9SS type A sorting domain-containing protein [Flavobacterium sp. GT3R68]|uniref:T9SS type A sorting domain-containing protein n=1 Tax=Flavobacterium sp. GT3R68 TaxID=2594437 RepID=UPI000F85D237|nr:T9SS type A sorting domain-containing protein [Flavobacterium sp. GT3R68]RTY95984.1 T9SS type A sorting domain-containing protein [Flavobacterium sp. GSN2]TRW93757.1 T9SS type A sorting domain-containing protein [Flavobacterium sp. GT3R68]